MHCQIKEVTGKKRGNGTTTCVKAKDGTIIMEKDKILDRWSEYIAELYDDDRGGMPVMAPNDTAYKRWSCHSGLKLLCKLCQTSPPIYCFLGMPAMRTRWMAVSDAHKSG